MAIPQRIFIAVVFIGLMSLAVFARAESSTRLPLKHTVETFPRKAGEESPRRLNGITNLG